MLIPLLGNNKVQNVFLDDETLFKNDLGSLHDLYGMHIVYSIVIGDKEYIGSTNDFGGRISTHFKNGRSLSQDLYYDMRNSENDKIIKIVAICSSNSQRILKESEIIKTKRKEIIEKYIGNEKWLLSQQKIERIVKEHLYNKNLTI